MTHAAPLTRRSLVVVLVLALLFPVATVVVAPPVDASVASNRQDTVRKQVNTTRKSKGRRVLRKHAAATRRAQRWAQRLANCRCLKHRSAPFGAPSGWKAAAENVGRGSSLKRVHRALLRSPRHKANILKRRMTHIAVGVARRPNGEFFVVQGFYDMT